jgi:endoglucanase
MVEGVNPPSRRSLASLLGLLGLGFAALQQGGADAAAASPDRSAPAARSVPMAASATNPHNPLAGRSWGVYEGNADPSWQPYVNASGDTKQALGTIALAPKAKFFGAWIPNDQVAQKVQEYVDNATSADPKALVQLALFRMVPWEQDACHRLPTRAERSSYKQYVDTVAHTLGHTHAAVVLQPDGPILRCVPHGSLVPAHLLRYAAHSLSAQPHVSVYIEMGSADWFVGRPDEAVQMLLETGVAHTRGFALDTSHFDSVSRQIRFGHEIVKGLAAHGVHHKHFVIDTSDNGHAFTGEWYHRTHPHSPLGHAQPCSAAGQHHCVALGIPPTTDVASPAWGLSATRSATAARLVDGYLWVSRPWLVNQSGPFDLQRALDEVRYSPYQ